MRKERCTNILRNGVLLPEARTKGSEAKRQRSRALSLWPRAPHFHAHSTTSATIHTECGNLTGILLNKG